VTEVQLSLSVEAVRAIAQGDELVLDIEGDDIRVFLRCSDAAVATFKQQIEQAVLRMLPVGTTPH
jgi:hypothetical protein